MQLSSRIWSIYDAYYKDRSEKLFLRLAEYSKEFIHEYKKKLDDRYVISVSFEKLHHAVYSYYVDLIRYKEYHLSPDDKEIPPLNKAWTENLHDHKKKIFVNHAKSAAFITRYIARGGIISVIENPEIKPDLGRYATPQERKIITGINADFTLHVVCKMLELRPSDIDKETADALLYAYQYRDLNYRNYVLLYEEMDARTKQKEKYDTEINRLKQSAGAAAMMIKPINVMVASGRPTEEYRETALNVIRRVTDSYRNRGKNIILDAFLWEDSAPVGATEGDIQGRVFEAIDRRFGAQGVDILILFAKYRIGSGTVSEFEAFFEKAGVTKSHILFADIDDGDGRDVTTAEKSEYYSWLSSNENKWIPIGRDRDSIKSLQDFERYLADALREYVDQMLDGATA